MQNLLNYLKAESGEKRRAVVAFLLIFSFVYLGIVSLYAAELVAPATQIGKGKFHTEVYYRYLAKQSLNLTVSEAGQVRAGAATLNTVTNTDLESTGSGNGVMGKFTYQPIDEGLQIYVLGGITSFNLEIPSGTYSNTFATSDPGYIFGGGIKYTIVPYTIVTPAVSIDMSATQSRFSLTKFSAGDGKLNAETDHLLTIFELQGALTMSKKYPFNFLSQKMVADPYFGVKVIRTRTNLDDNTTRANFTGTRLGASPYFGVQIKPSPNVGLVFEGSVLEETSGSFGLTLGF